MSSGLSVLVFVCLCVYPHYCLSGIGLSALIWVFFTQNILIDFIFHIFYHFHQHREVIKVLLALTLFVSENVVL